MLDSGNRMMNLIEGVLEYTNLGKRNQELETIDCLLYFTIPISSTTPLK